MPPANPSSRHLPHRRAGRRFGAGLAISVLLHALLLSLQLGQPGLGTGGGAPISVTLAPHETAAPAAVPEPVHAPAPVPAPSESGPAAPAATAGSGLRLVDPLPAAVPEQAAAPVLAAPRKRSRAVAAQRKGAPASVPLIAADSRVESAFSVPLPELAPAAPDPLAQAATGPDTPGTSAPVEQETPEAPQPPVIAQQDDARDSARLAAEEESRLALERARVAEAEREVERAAEALRAGQQLALQRREDEQRREAELARRQAQALEQAQAQAQEQVREQQRLAQEQALLRQREQDELARRQAEQRLAEQASLLAAQEQARREAEEQARRLAEQLAAQREQTRRLAQEQAERLRAEEQARQKLAAERASEEARAGAQRQAAADRLHAQSVPPGQGGAGAGAGTTQGAGRAPADPLGGVGNRARELLRGVAIPGASPPPAARAMFEGRRALADGSERDVPLRLYVDSVRQKLERNAVLGGASLARGEMRADPLVSVVLRSDGSIDDVTILRSSGRLDMDEAVRRFARLNARYSAFPPNVAARFDVIEIRRIWRFAEGLKLMEEMR